MAGKFHATLVSAGPNAMELVFDQADWEGRDLITGIEVEIFERDKSLGIKQEPSDDDALGTVTVNLRRGPPHNHGGPTIELENASFQPPINPALVNSGSFELLVGTERFRLVVFMEPREWPHDKPPPWAIAQRNFIELGIVVRRLGRVVYSSLRPGVRPDRLAVLRGPVLTFIVDAPGDAMADAAERFWMPRSDVLHRSEAGRMSLEEVIEQIDRDLHREIGRELVWSQVNIVSHGNLAGLLMPLRRGTVSRELTAPDVRELQHRDFRKLDESASHVVIRGCTIGRDKALLKALSVHLGGCKVYAPETHLIAYQAVTLRGVERTRELLYRRYWAFRPGSNTNVGPAQIARTLEAQKDTMPLAPQRPFRTLVAATFNPRALEIPQFFRRPSDTQTHTLTFPPHGPEEVPQSRLDTDPGLRNGTTRLAEHFRNTDADAERDKAALTQPDHVPLSLTDPLWNDLEAWRQRGHWEIRTETLRDAIISPAGDPDPLRELQTRTTLSRVRVEACEIEAEITDVDVRSLPQFGSS